jgi:hypothetical protein
MITKKQFTDILKSFIEFEDFCDKQEELGIYLTESKLYNSVGILFDNAICSNFEETASDFIMWWMFEDAPKEVTVNDETIYLETIDDLWNYLVSCGYVK